MKTGKKIKMYRIANGLTQTELGEAVGLNANRIQQYENGARNPKMDRLEKIANILNISSYKLIGFDIQNREIAEEMLNDIVLEFGIDFIRKYLDDRK